jgi:chromosome partitioning protein
MDVCTPAWPGAWVLDLAAPVRSGWRVSGSARTIAVANQKGGTGKSTVAVNLAVALGETGKRVLVVDVDPQADATSMFGIDPAARERTLYDVMVGAGELPDAVLRDVASGVDLVVGDERMTDVELSLAGELMRERFLADAITGHTGEYDVVLIDCPPNVGLLTINAFCAAPEVLIVVSMIDRNAYKGAMSLLATVAALQRKKIAVAVTAVLRNNAEPMRSTYRLLSEALLDANLPLLATEIPMRAGFQNGVTAGVPLVRFDRAHPGTAAMRRLAAELQRNTPPTPIGS